MKTRIIVPIIVLIIAAHITIQGVNLLKEGSTCINCHDINHRDSSFLQRHLNKNITCIDCHSGGGSKGYADARKELIDAIFINGSAPLLKVIIQNESYNTKISHLKANCTKCHSSIEST